MRAKWGIATLSGLVCLLVGFLLLGPRPPGVAGLIDVSALPHVNASINGVTTLTLLCGLAAILTKRRRLHKRLMLTAFGLSTLFLVSYVSYHWFSAGPKKYEGSWPAFYFPMLISHIVLAPIVVPLALTTLYRGWHEDFDRHRRLARVALPIWLYVSVTGVAIYLMLYVL